MLKKVWIYCLVVAAVVGCGPKKMHADLEVTSAVQPILRDVDVNPTLRFKVVNNDQSEPLTLKHLKVSFAGTPYLSDIARVSLLVPNQGHNGTDSLLAATTSIREVVELSSNYTVQSDTTSLVLSVILKGITNLQHRLYVKCLEMDSNRGLLYMEPQQRAMYRFGVAVHSAKMDDVHTARIPALDVTNEGTLIAAYDARWESSRDLQGDIDVVIKRSSLRGVDWKPMHRVLDMGEYGGLPEKYNGVSDANITIDRNTGEIFIFGLWMHGVVDPNSGKWVGNLTEESTLWNHQWAKNGSLKGNSIKGSSQFLMTRSDDDGITWSEPTNLTAQLKRDDWMLYAPAPGHGITLEDGTLVVPTQGRDAKGVPFSTIMWSKDHGKSWTSGNPVKENTTECTVAQLSDGSLMLNMRDNANATNKEELNGRSVFITKDLGKTWVEHPTSREALVEPVCQASLHTHIYTDADTGKQTRLLLFMNPNSKYNRTDMTIKVSLDDGATWPAEYWVLLDEKGGYGYSSMATVDNDHIGVLYEGSRADMVFQLIPVKELLHR